MEKLVIDKQYILDKIKYYENNGLGMNGGLRICSELRAILNKAENTFNECDHDFVMHVNFPIKHAYMLKCNKCQEEIRFVPKEK